MLVERRHREISPLVLKLLDMTGKMASRMVSSHTADTNPSYFKHPVVCAASFHTPNSRLVALLPSKESATRARSRHPGGPPQDHQSTFVGHALSHWVCVARGRQGSRLNH